MHDVIRHLAVDKAEKECFGKVHEGHETLSVHGTRRLSIQSINIALLNQSSETSLRAIHVFTRSADIDLLRHILASSVLLSTLDLQGTEIKMLPNEIFSLFNLRFLGLRDTRIEILPEAIGRLQNLEVLDALGTGLLYLPMDVTKLRKLRHLYACVIPKGHFVRYGGVKVPRGIRKLTGLHALQIVKATTETLSNVAALTELRTLAVDDVTNEHSLSLCSAIMNMRHLVSLSITASNGNEVLPLDELHLPDTLSKLGLVGQLEKKRMPHILSSWSQLSNLTRLYLAFSKLDESSFPSLTVLRSLCFLDLSKAYDGKTLCFPAQIFPKLRHLEIEGAPGLIQVNIEEGALESLVELVFLDCPELKRLPDGIEFLRDLELLHLVNTGEGLIEMFMQEREANEFVEEHMKISHVRKVIVRSTEENFMRRITLSKEKQVSN